MLEKLVEFITEGTEDRFNDISLEDAALGHTLCEHRSQPGENGGPREALQAGLNEWLANHKRLQWDTEGHRYQWVLRDLIDEVQSGELNALEREELDFLCWTFILAERVADKAAYGRVRTLLAPFLNEIEVRRKEVPHKPGHNALAKRVHFLDTTDIERAPHGTIRTIAGIDISARGPLLKQSGHVKLFGSVPDDCTLVVENGCCSVLGYVMGRLAITHHCDVRHNISGVAISSLGSIRARNIIDRAYVVAKSGSVHVRRVENPRLLFAGERLVVMDSLRRGNIIAPDIDVHEDTLGGRIQVSRCFSGNRLRSTPELPLEIVFRKRLTTSDFGGVPTKEATRLMAEALRLKTRILTLESLIKAADREVERLSENALYFLCSNHATEKHADAIRRGKGRLEVIDRIIEGLLGMAYAVAERAADRAAAQGVEEGRHQSESAVMFGVADAVLNDVSYHASGDRDIHAFINRVADIREGLRKGVPGNRLASASLARLREELRQWLGERADLFEKIKQHEAQLRAQVDFGDFIQSAKETHSPERVLKRLLAAAKKQPATSAIAKKMNSNFVTAMYRNIEKRREAAEQLRSELLEKRNAFEEMASRLRTQHHMVVVLEKADQGEGPRVSGRFEGGVVLYADMVALEQEHPPEGTRLVVPDTGDAFKTYQRRYTSIVEAGR